MPGSRGGMDRGSGPPEKHKNIGFLSNTGSVPLKNHKATKPAFNVGPLSSSWRAHDGSLIVVFGSYLPSLSYKKTKNKKKTLS